MISSLGRTGKIYRVIPNVVMLNSTFDGFVELKSVVIPEGVTNIQGAFYGC